MTATGWRNSGLRRTAAAHQHWWRPHGLAARLCGQTGGGLRAHGRGCEQSLAHAPPPVTTGKMCTNHDSGRRCNLSSVWTSVLPPPSTMVCGRTRSRLYRHGRAGGAGGQRAGRMRPRPRARSDPDGGHRRCRPPTDGGPPSSRAIGLQVAVTKLRERLLTVRADEEKCAAFADLRRMPRLSAISSRRSCEICIPALPSGGRAAGAHCRQRSGGRADQREWFAARLRTLAVCRAGGARPHGLGAEFAAAGAAAH
jgi:hypothetical protein